MLLWFAKGPHKLKAFRFKVFFIVFCFHLILLIYGLFFGNRQILKIEVKKRNLSNVPVILLPFSKKVTGALKSVKAVGKNVINEKSKSIKSKVIVSNIQDKNLINSGLKKVQIGDKKIKDKIIKNEEQKKPIIKPKEIKKNILKKEVIKPKEKISEDIVKKLEQNEINEITNKEKLASKEKVKEEVNSVQEPIYVGRKDMEQLEFEDLIEYEIAKHWQPPMGLSKSLKCVLSAYIDFEGKIRNIKILESSKSLAFDMSAKRDLAKTNFPKEIWGHEIAPQFGPEE